MEHTLLAKDWHLRPSAKVRVLTVALSVAMAGVAAHAQTAVGGQVTAFKDTSMLKPPAGVKVAVIEWEDPECPACARAFPIVHAGVKQYNIPLVRYDFHINGHIWSADAALYARYLQDKVSADLATQYRREVFASQFKIASQDDLKQFTQQFFSRNGKQMPFVVDPTGQLAKEIKADNDLGLKLGLAETPTIIVVTPKEWIQVKDVMDLYQAIDKAEADTKNMAAVAPVKPAPHK